MIHLARLGKSIQILILFILLIGQTKQAGAQVTTFNFHHLTNSEGLSDGIVHTFAQDKYGFMWIGTSYGLNRFDGINVKTWFAKPNDTAWLNNNYVHKLYCDSKSNIWIGSNTGICRYDYEHDRFINYKSKANLSIGDIREDANGRIWLGTNYGLYYIDEQKRTVERFAIPGDTVFARSFYCSIRQFTGFKNGTWYIASPLGVKYFNPLTYKYGDVDCGPATKTFDGPNGIISVSMDSTGNLWVAKSAPEAILIRIELASGKIFQYDHFLKQQKGSTNNLTRILTDNMGRVWILSNFSGVSLYDRKKDDFTDFKNDPFIPNNLLINQNLSIYQNKQGILWVGTNGYGLSYFNPEEDFFHTVFPSFDKSNPLSDLWCRAVVEDHKGYIWLATGSGLARYDRQQQSFSYFLNSNPGQHVLYTNSIRSLVEDDQGDIWIGTPNGLNRLHVATGQTDFFDEKQGIPKAFFWMLAKDKDGEVWLGSASGLFRYMRPDNKFDNLKNDPVLSKYASQNVQALYCDSQNRLWIGLMDVGLVMYDKNKKSTTLLTIKDSLILDTRFSAFAEDKDGVIWIGSEAGLTAYDPSTHKSKFFTRENGLSSDRTNNLMVDSDNRIWIGTSNGLCLLDAKRKNIRKFDKTDGLLETHFNEQAACSTRDGLFIFPTYKGFLTFRPSQFHENVSLVPLYITSFKVSDKPVASNPENLKEIRLRHDQNFFNIELAGLNYDNPYQCRYAYKLEPFDKDWVYTANRLINYTNVPAGSYTFRYKVITDNPDWNVPEKTLSVSIRQIFYKTWWFRILVALILLSGLLAFYRYRVRQRERIILLQGKTQLLEKEKTQVMYENLKQHLNPHFLFNSLTSLGSLIRLDQHLAGDFLDKMSKVYRYILKNRDNETVHLSEELKFVEIYIQLQKTRFESGLQVNMNIPEEFYHRNIAPVTLQNLVENAIKHNVADKDSPLIIDLFTENDYLVVRNNLQRKNFVETSNKQGLVNMCSLYRYLSDRPMVIEETMDFFIVKTPLI